MERVTRWPPLAWIAGGLVFIPLATANAAGYRYGVSDQAFYIPVVLHALNPATFPRDAALIDAEGRLMIADEILAWIIRSTGLSLETLFFAAYLISLVLIWAALVLIGTRISRRPWMALALGAAFTLRHRISRTSANTFEPYFHPRMLAFGFGLLAVAAVLRRRDWTAVALVAICALIHVTTAMWFAVLIGTALVILDSTFRRLAIVAAVGVAAFATWAVTLGPLRTSLVRMDDHWLQAVAAKDSLFPFDWPIWAWVLNLALLAVLWLAVTWRDRRGVAAPEDRALAWGATVLVSLFLVTLPLVWLRLALPTELQISRIFWLVDLLATAYAIAAIADASSARRLMPRLVLAAVVLLSLARGVYVMTLEHPERALFATTLPHSPWEDAMAWLSRQSTDVHVLADPGHSWKYGTSVRVSAGRDVFLEEVKDSAIAIYSREVATRVVERSQAIGDFAALTPERARGLADHYGLDYLVAEARLALPVAYQNQQFIVYRLSERGRASTDR